jgi:hypothetical protein
MDKERRSRLKSVVGQARRVVEDDVRVQLRRLGIDENEIKPVERLPHLSDADKELRQKIIEALEKEQAGDISYCEAFARYVRHAGFTNVNRIAALRAMEVRNLIKESMIRRDAYGGRSRREYELAERERISDPYELLKAGLVEAFDEVGAEIRVLFDVNSEYSLVFLEHKALLELARLLGEEVPEEDWKEDDIIGWIYQYYNEEARTEFKRAKRNPKADDIPVTNQFYTPRWVVRVLVDNTLGRLWLEMNRRCPKLGDPVKRTSEQLENPSGDKVDDFCSYLVPLSQEPPPRERKRVRQIKVLDPACGSGHFLMYAFDVLFRMYREDEPDTPVDNIPRLILENNLFGIDIDLRAIQLAALSLYLKAKSHNPRLKITRMNLVCADARITDGRVRKVFLDRFAADPELQRIFAKIFEDLKYTYEIGSLLKVREPFEKLLERRSQEGGVQAVLLPRIEGQTAISRSGKLEGQAKLDVKVVENRETAQIIAIPKEVTLEQMLNALKEFEKEAMEKRDMGTLLFATEAEKSVGLLALLSGKYDVVLMNPAYGKMPPKTKEYADKRFPRTKNDYYAVFIEQAVSLADFGGFVGMLTSRTFMFLRTFEILREDILWNDALCELVLDTGFGVLDGAIVETAATVLKKTMGLLESDRIEKSQCTFCRLLKFDTKDKEKAFMDSLKTYVETFHHTLWNSVTFGDLAKIHGIPYAYWASSAIRSLFVVHPPLDRDVANQPQREKIADVKNGMTTGDEDRFTRLYWEVDQSTLGRGGRWVPYAKAGGYDCYYASLDWVVLWDSNGRGIKDYDGSTVRNEGYFFRKGLTYTNKPSPNKPYFAIRRLPQNCIFSGGSPGCFPNDDFEFQLMAIISSTPAYILFKLYSGEHNWEVGDLARLPVPLKALKSHRLAVLAQESHDLLGEWDTGDETSINFIIPWTLQVLCRFDSVKNSVRQHPLTGHFRWSDWPSARSIRAIMGSPDMTLHELAELCVKRQRVLQKRLEDIRKEIDDEAYSIYGVSDEDMMWIESELVSQQKPILERIESGENEFGENETTGVGLVSEPDHVARLLSYYLERLIASDQDGIVPLHQIIDTVRKHLANDFDCAFGEKKEREIQEIFGKSLKEWVTTEYFDFHVNLYKRRPIFWHLTSCNFSSARGSTGVMNIFLHYHKLERETIPKILTNYVKPELETTKWKTERLKRELQEARNQKNRTKEKELSKQLETTLSVLEELQGFQKALETVHNPRTDKTKLPRNPTWLQQKISEVRDNGYRPVIDYGVRVNIEPLKEAGLLHKAAQRVK